MIVALSEIEVQVITVANISRADLSRTGESNCYIALLTLQRLLRTLPSPPLADDNKIIIWGHKDPREDCLT